ncbi:hypothetical protein B0H16DRAFT_1560829 [Mycena metata]|uniref:F-box domain-containing protein n=1 Tax=Mycena metata TaxID=1033252 RepID=A0AAD7IIL1_9AGAR|nr:hypothetical protein B0H16DRAFT_1560829 [Mycena metata]
MAKLDALFLPPEIVELVIDHIDDRGALRTCSLVSLQWVLRCRIHLFRSVTVQNVYSIHTLVELLESPFSTLGGAIRHLSVELTRALVSSLGPERAEYAASYLTRLSNACALESLQFFHHQSGFSSNSEILLSPWSCFESLQVLSIGAVKTSPDVFDFIASFPKLRELEMDGAHWNHWVSKAPCTPPKNLRVVRLSRCAADAVLNWLLPENLPPTCSSLTLGSISDSQLITLPRALKRCGPVLEQLSLTLRLVNHNFVPPDLSQNTNIRYLRIEPDLYFEALPHLLCTLTSTSLEQIELVMPGRAARLQSHDAARWAELDRHLLRSQFSLVSIKVQVHKAVDEDTIAEYLPLCCARGIVSFISKPVLYLTRFFAI